MLNTYNISELEVKERESSLSSVRIEDNNHEKVLISIRHVSKKFCRKLRRSMAYGIADLFKNLLGMKPNTITLRKDEFWALDDVSFVLRQGDALGIIGVNGSGKTTLLRLLSGIFPPDKGEIHVKGRVGALVAVGAGFHPHMTGRENIYLNGTILGMTRREIQAKFGSIVDFAEIGEFLDAPVSAYSSGMRVRLGFSIALHCVPDILLVDEVLSVGDLGFRNKSLRRMHEYREKANALIFVSHQLEQIRALCNRVIILNKGKVVYDGTTHEGCAIYGDLAKGGHLEESRLEDIQSAAKGLKGRQSSFEEFELLDLGILNTQYQKTNKIAMNDPLIIFLEVKTKKELRDIYVNIVILNEENQKCIWISSKNRNNQEEFSLLEAGKNYKIIARIAHHHLVPNAYIPAIALRSDRTGETYERIWSDEPFQVVTDRNTLPRGVIATQAEWALEASN